VELCRACLAAEREARPRDAGAVAATVAGYLADVEERARQAELERAAAEARTAEQRKRRRVQLALAASVLVLLGLVGFGLWWRERAAAGAAAERAARDSRVTAGVSEALRETRERVEEAWGLADFPDRMQHATDAAVAALRRGDDFARDGAPDEVARAVASAHGAVEELSRHTRLIQTFRVINLTYAEEPDRLWQYSPRMAEALKEFGLDPLHDSVDDVAKAITSSRLRDFLLEMLLAWHRRIRDDRLGQVTRLVRQQSGGALARWQNLLDAKDVPGLVAFAASPEALRLGPTISISLFHDLVDAKQFAACRTLLRAAAERSPHNEWLHFGLGSICLYLNPPEYAEALRHTSAAAVLRPESGVFQAHLGDCYAGLRSYPQAITCYRKAIELGYGPAVCYLQLSYALATQKDWDGAVAAVREAIRLQPKYLAPYLHLAGIVHDSGRYAEGLKALADAIREHPDLALEPRYYLRYNAACFAMNCADGLGVNAPPQAERPAYRKQALDFLTSELAAHRKLAGQDPAQAHKDMQRWLADEDLASVRNPTAAGRLPPDERDAWNKLWREVRILRDQTAPPPCPPTVK
jgi:tetratricopeptide (TPR) repeat protein